MGGNARPYILILLVLVAGALFYQHSLRLKEGSLLNVIRLSGNIEVTDAEVSAKIAERLAQRLVDEGENVEKGQLIGRLEDRELRQEVDLKQAEVQAAQANLDELLAGSRPEEIREAEAAMERFRAAHNELLAGSRPQEIASAEATVERAQADLTNEEKEVARFEKLFRDKVASEEQYDLARTRFEVAKARLKEARENLKLVVEGPRQEDILQAESALKEAEERHALIKKGPREEKIEQARAVLKQAETSLKLARTRLGYTEIVSPLDGVVLSKNIEPGEYVVPGTPIVTIADLEHTWVRAYVHETDLGRIKLGQKVKVATDTYPGKIYEGTLSFISSEAEFTPKSVQTEKERVKLVYRVKIDIHNPDGELKPGMPADAEILLSPL